MEIKIVKLIPLVSVCVMQRK